MANGGRRPGRRPAPKARAEGAPKKKWPYHGALVELRREQGRLDEAEQELGTLVADMRKLFGPEHASALEAEAVAARLRHAQPDGAAAGAAELRAVVERMTEFLGAAHQDTRKWQRVLEELPVEFVLEQ